MNTAGNFVRVVIPSPVKESLIYHVPAAFRECLSVGMRVIIPLGKRRVTGIVFELLASTSRAETKEILALPDERPILDSTLLHLSQWIAKYYLASLGEVLGTILPPSLRSQSQRTVVFKDESVLLNDAVERKILELCRQRKGKVGVKALTRFLAGRNIYQALERLESVGAIEIRERLPGQRKRSKETVGDPESPSPRSPGKFILNQEQKDALATIEDRLAAGTFETFLLHGVTGSGKTEIYLRAMERVREAGRRSLILIPEISLTPQLIDRLKARFPGRVGILHSALTGAERWDHWWQIARGNVDVVVGARSAVFAPLPDLGLIVVDEEHDPSYKQEEGVRYNGRDVAVVRGKLLGCPVILGSATPAIESYENCLRGRYRLLEMTQRVEGRSLPQIKTLDLRSEFIRPNAGETKHGSANGRHERVEQRLIAPRLVELLKENYQKSRQSLIFLNRRGFSNFLQCSLCGCVLRCSYCSVTLTLHLKQKNVCCHHCNFRRPVTDTCPDCGNSSLAGVGAGTEQIEQALRRLLPEARIERMDRDTTSRRGSHEELIRGWERGEIDILVGTQMITKGHDVSGVTLVGALLADVSLNVPDFRAAERTFQLLSQVAGRSGRGDDPGTVIIQTYAPDHYVMEHLIKHDYKNFFAAEIAFRRALNYPPFSRLVGLRVEGPKLEEVEAKAKSLAKRLRDQQSKSPTLRQQIEVLGPAPAPIEKLRNRYRWQLLVKGKQISSLLEFARHARDILPRSRRLRLNIDVDPYNML
jgi:primosomal protein N' (replication factor Y) (superfamily II helicase)